MGTKKKASKAGKKTRSKPKSRSSSKAEFPADTERVESWEEYLSWVTRHPFSGWAFRGQANAGWDLTSTLTRTLIERKIKPELWEEQEERTLRIFKRKAHHFLDRTPAEEEEFEWLALMQHHGAPTRLLDFTWSPYVAAFFALEGGAKIRDTALRELYRMNISYATLFPGLDGLSQSMRQELEYTWDMDKPDELKILPGTTGKSTS